MTIQNITDKELQQAHRIAELEAEVERLRTELSNAQDEFNCTEATLEAASCDLPSVAFDNGFDCMGDFAMAVWQGFKSERDALKLDAERLTQSCKAALSALSAAIEETKSAEMEYAYGFVVTQINASMKGAA
jgi:hypothetical protein